MHARRFLPLRADQIQPPDDHARVAAKRAEASIAAAILAAIRAHKATIDPATVTAALATNDFAALWEHLGYDRLGASLVPALHRLTAIHDTVAATEMALISAAPVAKAALSTLRTPDVILLSYDPLDEVTVAAQRTARDAIVRRIEDNSDRAAQQIVTQGLQQAKPPADVAAMLRVSVGLHEQEAAAIESYRRSLSAAGRASLDRALRDRRFDASVTRAAEDPAPIEAAKIDRMTERYADKYQALVAARIAGDQAMAAANAGRRDAWRQAGVSSGQTDTIRRFWRTAGDERVCYICRAIPGMNPDGVTMSGLYSTPDGDVGMPPFVHPRCRCTEQYQYVNATSLRSAA